MRILVIEDDHSIRETLGMVLESFGHQPLLTSNTEEATKALSMFKPEVILLDLLLEGNVATPFIQVARDLMSTSPPRIIIISAMANAENVAERNRVEFIRKPFEMDALRDALIYEGDEKEKAVKEQRQAP